MPFLSFHLTFANDASPVFLHRRLFKSIIREIRIIIYSITKHHRTSTSVYNKGTACFLTVQFFRAVSSLLFLGVGGDAWQQAEEGRDTGRVKS